jgi:hypothetical protein
LVKIAHRANEGQPKRKTGGDCRIFREEGGLGRKPEAWAGCLEAGSFWRIDALGRPVLPFGRVESYLEPVSHRALLVLLFHTEYLVPHGPGMLITVFTIVTDAFSPNALPFSVVIAVLPAVENVTPALAMMVPTIVPPPAALIVAELPTCQKTFLA